MYDVRYYWFKRGINEMVILNNSMLLKVSKIISMALNLEKLISLILSMKIWNKKISKKTLITQILDMNI